MNYQEYMKSDLWKENKEKALFRAGYKCEFCGKPAFTAHHVRYPKGGYGKDSIENMVAVCRDCHAKSHGIIHEANSQGITPEYIAQWTPLWEQGMKTQNLCTRGCGSWVYLSHAFPPYYPVALPSRILVESCPKCQTFLYCTKCNFGASYTGDIGAGIMSRLPVRACQHGLMWVVKCLCGGHDFCPICGYEWEKIIPASVEEKKNGIPVT